ncbi:MAG: DUF4249 domain-containing protein [Bacteroidales bacterium]|nr:DUF4249 domain-containing protein [Bacteroidales bacterium]
MKQNFAIALLASLLFSSCDKLFVIDIPDADQLVVVNSFFNGDEELSLTVTKSMQPQQNEEVVELKDAIVALFRDNTFVENLSYYKSPVDSLGRFYSSTIPVSGSTYKVEVEAEHQSKVITQSELPSMVDIVMDKAIWVKWITAEDSAFTIRYFFEIAFNDPPEDNFYYITASVPVYKLDTINNTSRFEAWQYAEIVTGELPNHELYINNALLFKDANFNASLKKITGTATMYSIPDHFIYNEDKSFVLDKSMLHMELHSLSKDAFNFCSSYAKKLATQDDVYSEPTVIYTNVENGLGVFAGESIAKKDILIHY